ncbi:MAG: RNA methyltransferase [Candidatus Diapherotrites archaeon]
MNSFVVLSRTEGEENIGFAARAMKNFGLEKLVLVNPKASHLSGLAKSRAMHAKEILANAKTVKTLKEALKAADFSVAVTARPLRARKGIKGFSTPKELAEKFVGTNASVALVFGNEKNGLGAEEVGQCDFMLSIPSSRKYFSLNLSHAVVIVLYELFKAKKSAEPRAEKTAKRKIKRALLERFSDLADASGSIDDKKEVMRSFKALVARSPITEKEAKAVLAVLSEAGKSLALRKGKS